MCVKKEKILSRLEVLENPPRKALSSRYPFLKGLIIFVRRSMVLLKNKLNRKIARTHLDQYFPCVSARHQSVLIRKLGDSDVRLQQNKVKNLEVAVKCLDGLVINPGEVFSYWDVIGKPTKERGFVDGMLLSNGRVVEGLGGGLCQLSNFLSWIFLHLPVEVVERYHHSMDVFPDSGRVLPFGSGATVLYNFVDLKMKNVSKVAFQLKIWLTDGHLKGQILTPVPMKEKFHLFEKEHCFVEYNGKYFRYNEIWREKLVEGVVVGEEKIYENFAPVLYEVDETELGRNGVCLVRV